MDNNTGSACDWNTWDQRTSSYNLAPVLDLKYYAFIKRVTTSNGAQNIIILKGR